MNTKKAFFPKQIFLFAVLLLAVFSLSKIRFLDDHTTPGSEVEFFTSVANAGNNDADDVRVIAYFPELGYIERSNVFDIESNYHYDRLTWWDIPSEMPKGDYLVRITASNDDDRSRKFRYITVD